MFAVSRPTGSERPTPSRVQSLSIAFASPGRINSRDGLRPHNLQTYICTDIHKGRRECGIFHQHIIPGGSAVHVHSSYNLSVRIRDSSTNQRQLFLPCGRSLAIYPCSFLNRSYYMAFCYLLTRTPESLRSSDHGVSVSFHNSFSHIPWFVWSQIGGTRHY